MQSLNLSACTPGVSALSIPPTGAALGVAAGRGVERFGVMLSRGARVSGEGSAISSEASAVLSRAKCSRVPWAEVRPASQPAPMARAHSGVQGAATAGCGGNCPALSALRGGETVRPCLCVKNWGDSRLNKQPGKPVEGKQGANQPRYVLSCLSGCAEVPSMVSGQIRSQSICPFWKVFTCRIDPLAWWGTGSFVFPDPFPQWKDGDFQSWHQPQVRSPVSSHCISPKRHTLPLSFHVSSHEDSPTRWLDWSRHQKSNPSGRPAATHMAMQPCETQPFDAAGKPEPVEPRI